MSMSAMAVGIVIMFIVIIFVTMLAVVVALMRIHRFSERALPRA